MTDLTFNQVGRFESGRLAATRRANIHSLAAHLAFVFKHRFRFGSAHSNHHRFLRFLNLRFYEAYLTYLYLGIKFMYFLNVIIQVGESNMTAMDESCRYL